MSNFTPEQVQEILDIYFENFAHKQYTGARYVPIFGRKGETSIDWDNSAPYEPLTVVLYEGNSYTSRQFVPAGVAITNELYWAETGNFNAQIEQYRQEVLDVYDVIGEGFTSENTVADVIGSGFSSENPISGAVNGINEKIGSGFTSQDTVADAVNGINEKIGSGFTSQDTVADAVNGINEKIGSGFSAAHTVKDEFDTLKGKNKLFLIGDSYMANTSTIADALARTTKYQVINYAVAGTGFLADALASGMTFINQLTKIYNEHPEISKDDMILVYGGVNDYSSNQTLSSMLTAISAFYTAYQNASVKPRLALVFCNAPNHFNGNSTFIPWQASIKSSLGRLNVPVVQYSEYWLLPEQSTVWGADQHPNSTGCNVIASYLSQIVNGEYTGVHREFEVNLNGNSGISASYAKCFAKFDNGTICLQPNLQSANASAAGTYQAFIMPFKPCFGQNSGSPAIAPIVEDNAKNGAGGSWGSFYWLYNTVQSIVYLINPNSEAVTSRTFISGSIVTYSPTLAN